MVGSVSVVIVVGMTVSLTQTADTTLLYHDVSPVQQPVSSSLDNVADG